MIAREVIERIWSLNGHVPAVHSDWWEEQIPTNFRAQAMGAANPVPVTERRQVPTWLRARPALIRLVLCAEALLLACFDPILHYSLAAGRLLYSAGVTVLVIEQRRDGEIVACPWSMGESRKVLMKRLCQVRMLEAPRLNPREAYIARYLLPRCNAAISQVSGFGIMSPGTNILASGGEVSIALTLGVESIHFALDHRVHDPEAAGALYERFFRFLEEAA